MFIVGIDIAKFTHQATVIDLSGNTLVKPFKFSNTTNGFATFLEKLHTVNPDISLFEFGMEATGHYWLNLYCKLLDYSTSVHVINPVQSDALRGLYIRKTKTDAKDSFIIAELIRFGRYSKTTLANDDTVALRELTRQRFYLIDRISDTKRKVISYIDKVFPEYHSLFSDMFGTTSMELLSTYTSPDEIANLDTDTLAKLLKTASKGRFGASKANQIQEVAKNSFGAMVFASSSALAVKQLLEQIKLLESQVSELENFISEILTKFETTLTTINGVGTTLAAVFVAEIGDINRFESPEKLAAFAGIDPTVKQSGEFSGTRAKMSKRGSPYLRRALYLAAVACNLHNPAMRAIYNHKRAQGKAHAVALSVVERKLINIIFYLMKTGKVYEMVMPENHD